MKKKFFFALLSIINTAYTIAQSNLVPNPSFEIHTDCSNKNITNALPWSGPTCNSSDYFNGCISSAGVPFNGYNARTGNAMAAIWGLDGVGLNYREYLQTPMINTLIVGKCYYVEFYINLYRGLKYGINNMAARFSDSLFTTSSTCSSPTVINLIPSILKFGNPVVCDTLKWTKISGIYTANGTEKYITIGNFKNDMQTDTLNVNAGNYPGAYYFVDDLSVIPTDSISMPPNAGRDTAIVLGDSVFIGQQLYGLHCNWYSNNALLDTNTSGIWVKPTVTTTYVVEQNLCGNMGYDTVTVNVSTSGISKYTNAKKIFVYPNPAKNNVYIEGKNINEIALFDLLGNEILNTKAQEIDISNLINGIYFINIKTKENTNTQKIVVQH